MTLQLRNGKTLHGEGKGTSPECWYAKATQVKLCGFSDSDWAGYNDDRRSVSASVFTLGTGVVTWSSKKQECTALSSTKVVYVSLTAVACQAM
uniref:Uncharacterized protein n=1 Tax=Lactuca sativa TaxID=4236 RepID=A0A9R1WL80_LACSA|nr:hypothetical protein LSAT_V11C100001550 [Lactuca sativa]